MMRFSPWKDDPFALLSADGSTAGSVRPIAISRLPSGDMAASARRTGPVRRMYCSCPSADCARPQLSYGDGAQRMQ